MMILQQTRGALSSGDQLALDLPFAETKSLAARIGPTPTFTRGSGATYVGSDGLLHGVDTSTTSNSISLGSKTFTLTATAGQDQLYRTGDAVDASNGSNSMVGTVTSYTPSTQVLVCNMTSIAGTGTFTSWRIGYRGPRFDHDPVTLASRGLLIEEGRTNQALYSGAIVNDVGWFQTNATIAASGTGKDGNTSYIITETATNSSHLFGNFGSTGNAPGTSIINGTTYTGSIFLKKATGSVDWIQLTFGSGGFGFSQYAHFNVGNGTVGNFAGLASGTTPRIENYGNGWYRCSITAVATATTTGSNLATSFTNNTNGTTRLPSYAGSTSNSVLASLCQFEAGSFATSYIPTTTSALARSADVCSITGANFTGMWNALEGSVLANCIYYSPVTNPNGQRIWEATDGTTSNFIRSFRAASTGFADFRNTSGGSTNVIITGSSALSSFQTIKHSYGFANNDYVFYVNNSQIGTDNLGNMPISQNAMYIGLNSPSIGAGQINGTIAAIRYYRKRLANSKLASLTV